MRHLKQHFKVHGKDRLSQFETVLDCLGLDLYSWKVDQSSTVSNCFATCQSGDTKKWRIEMLQNKVKK